MSSFKRKPTSITKSAPSGTRPSPSSPATLNLSTGIPSLDDVLGGGLPLASSLLVLAPDLHSAYGELVSKFFISQGIAIGDHVLVIDDDPEVIMTAGPWISTAVPNPLTTSNPDEDEDTVAGQDEKMKIAWRYGRLKQFKTTVNDTSSSLQDFCADLSLASQIPREVLQEATSSGRLQRVRVEELRYQGSDVLRESLVLLQKVMNDTQTTSKTVRICFPFFGSPHWGDLQPATILRFLHDLRSLLCQYPHACANICLTPHLSTESFGGSGWTQKLGWVVDASITLAAFGADPSLSAAFPSHHGFLHIHATPSPHTLLTPSEKHSRLRGIASSSSAMSGGLGENNLAFKCTRKRLLFETLHLNVEGGVGERRTTASTTTPLTGATGELSQVQSSDAAVQVGLESTPNNSGLTQNHEKESVKSKKRVAFQSNRPDLFDF